MTWLVFVMRNAIHSIHRSVVDTDLHSRKLPPWYPEAFVQKPLDTRVENYMLAKYLPEFSMNISVNSYIVVPLR